MLRNFTLLYVEDQKDARDLIKMMFEDEVKELYMACDGLEGMHLYKDKHPDIIITDINMPHLDGLSLIKKIREEDTQTPILLISAHDDKESLITALNAGASGFISKPINIDTVFSKLNVIAKDLQEKIELQSSKEKEMEELYKLAHYDDLTKIPNRYLFDILLKQTFSRAKREDKPLALFFIDVDNFKYINDTYGHNAGDAVLKELSSSIQKIIRSEDIFARRSGDEFLLLVEGEGNKEHLSNFARKVIEQGAKPILFEGNELRITLSVGISMFPDNASNIEELVHFADVAMYQAKRNGKNNFCFF